MTNIDFGFGIFFVILGIIVIIIGLISTKAEKIIPLQIRFPILNKRTPGFWIYIAMELFLGFMLIASGAYWIFLKN